MRTLIILVNRNNKNDTIECLESLRRCEGDFDVWVSDNASSDGSIEAFMDWASGRGVVRGGSLWKSVETRPILVKDMSWAYFSNEGDAIADRKERWVTFVSTGGSKGFPAGNNVGLRYGLTRDYDYFWILGNDSVVDPKALVELLARARQDRTIGVCGSTVVFYNAPTTIQCLGGSVYDIAKASSIAIGWGRTYPEEVEASDQIDSKLDHVYGTSMLVSRAMVEKIGLMNEELYLYFDEIDWALRMKGYFRNAYAPKSVVFHKFGGTLGQGDYKKPSRESVRFMTINRILFTRKHHPSSLIAVIGAIGIEIAKNIAKGRPRIAIWMFQDVVYALFRATYPLGYLAE